MKPVLAAALAATLILAACDRPAQPRTGPTAGPGSTASPGPSAPVHPMPQTGSPTPGEKKEGANPVQGQVDPKQSEQRKDFQQRGDSAGPASEESKPKQGG